MSENKQNDKPPDFHIEDGVPVFNAPASEEQRKKSEFETHDRNYKDEQIAINKGLKRATYALVIATIVTSLIGGYQACIMTGELDEIKGTSLMNYHQTLNAGAQAVAANKFAASATEINTGIGTAVKKLNLQATDLAESVKQTSRLADANERANANSLASERPWIGAAIGIKDFEAGKIPEYSITFQNVGKRPAKVRLTASGENTYFIFPASPQYIVDTSPSSSILVPGQPTQSVWGPKNALLKQDLDLYRAGPATYYIYGDVEYSEIDGTGNYWTHVCMRWVPNGTTANFGFANCDQYNEAQ